MPVFVTAVELSILSAPADRNNQSHNTRTASVPRPRPRSSGRNRRDRQEEQAGPHRPARLRVGPDLSDQPAIDLNGQVQSAVMQFARPFDTLTEPLRVGRANGELGAIVGAGHPGAIPLIELLLVERSKHDPLASDHDHEFTKVRRTQPRSQGET